MDLPSFHDDYLVGYAVDGEKRQITFRINAWEGDRVATLTFSGVEGHCFERDAGKNIIFSIEACEPAEILSKFRAQICESYRMSGAPGQWAEDLSAAAATFTERGVRGFLLSASFGMSGWILAEEATAVTCPLSEAAA